MLYTLDNGAKVAFVRPFSLASLLSLTWVRRLLLDAMIWELLPSALHGEIARTATRCSSTSRTGTLLWSLLCPTLIRRSIGLLSTSAPFFSLGVIGLLTELLGPGLLHRNGSARAARSVLRTHRALAFLMLHFAQIVFIGDAVHSMMPVRDSLLLLALNP